MKNLLVIAFSVIAATCSAGLFDSVKNVAGGVVGIGNTCQAAMPGGSQCKNAPVDGSPYCQQHKCRMCNNLAWADGVCRSCAPKAEANAKAERRRSMQAEQLRRTKAEERSRLNRGGQSRNVSTNAGEQRGQTGCRRAAAVREQCDERPFAGFELGRIAPFGKEKGERIKLKNAYLSIFEDVHLSYGAHSHLLNCIGFGSMPIHADSDSELQPYVEKVVSEMRVLGYNMTRDMRHVQKPWTFKGKDHNILLMCNEHKTVTDGVSDNYKELVLVVENPSSRKIEKEYEEKNKTGDGIVHEIVPYGAYGTDKFLHCRSGAIYSVSTNGNGIAYCNGKEEGIVEKNGGVVKLPRQVSHSDGLEFKGEYSLSPYSVGSLAFTSNSKKRTNVVDLTAFAVNELTNAAAFAKISYKGLRVVLPDQAITARWLSEFIGDRRRTFTDFLGTDEAMGRQQVMNALASVEKVFQFPGDDICPDHPLLYKELASGASKDWCRIWLAVNAKSCREYSKSRDNDLRLFHDLTSVGDRLGKGEIEAEVGGHEIILSFSELRNILVSVKCKFNGDGVSKDALIAKYKAQFGEAATVETKDSGIKVNRSVSILPRTRKNQEKLVSMSMSDNELARTVARASNALDPFGEMTLDSPAEIYYQRGELLEISGSSVMVQTHLDSFVKCVFLSNSSYNRLAYNGRLCLIDDGEKVPADAIIDVNGEVKVLNDSCGDELSCRMGSITGTITRLKAATGKVYEITITGKALLATLSRELQKAADERKKDERKKEKESAALNF